MKNNKNIIKSKNKKYIDKKIKKIGRIL